MSFWLTRSPACSHGALIHMRGQPQNTICPKLSNKGLTEDSLYFRERKAITGQPSSSLNLFSVRLLVYKIEPTTSATANGLVYKLSLPQPRLSRTIHNRVGYYSQTCGELSERKLFFLSFFGLPPLLAQPSYSALASHTRSETTIYYYVGYK
jgi:hypothetical protein